MLMEFLQQTPAFEPGQWSPCPPVSDRAAWESLPGADRLLQAGRQAAKDDATVPALPLSLWLRFTADGDRTQYENAYFGRRRALVRLALAEAVENQGNFIPLIGDYVWAICEESAWQLPAHNSYIRDTPQLPLADTSRPIVDLFAAETAALLAMVHYLLGDALERYAPGLPRRLVREVTSRVLTPWQRDHFWWKGNGGEPMCNWTPWCVQNCLIAFSLLQPCSKEYLYTVVRSAAYSLDCFLKDYGEDGACSEGAQYYGHAGLCLFNGLDILCAIAPGVFDRAWEEPKLRGIAEYISNVHISGSFYLNFADCSPLAGARGAREFLFGKRIGSQPLMALAAEDVVRWPGGEPTSDSVAGINLYYAAQAAFAEAEICTYAKEHAGSAEVLPEDSWYPSIGLRICRRAGYTVGIKAGCNADSHNHNDTGSVTLYKDGKPLLIDLGVESYTKKTFSPQRYEIWTMRSGWHNLPEFDPEGAAWEQKPGAEFAAREVEKLEGGLSMDIAPAYGAVPGLGAYCRKAVLQEDGLHLSDKTDYPGMVALSLLSVEAPQLEESGIRFGELGFAAIKQMPLRITTEQVEVTDARLRTAWPQMVWRTRIWFEHELDLTVG